MDKRLVENHLISYQYANTCWSIENGFLITTNSVVTKLVERFSNLWPRTPKHSFLPLGHGVRSRFIK